MSYDSERELTVLHHLMRGHRVMRHPIWYRFAAGDFSLSQVRPFAMQYYLHVSTTRLYAAGVLARCADESIQFALASVLWDEYGRGDPQQTHPAQFRRFLGYLGLTQRDWKATRPIPELMLYRDVHYRLCTQEPFWVGFGAVAFAMEWPIPNFYRHLVTGFRKALDLDDTALDFFLSHVLEDEAHAAGLSQAIGPHLADPRVRQALQEGITRSLDARVILMDGLLRITFRNARRRRSHQSGIRP